MQQNAAESDLIKKLQISIKIMPTKLGTAAIAAVALTLTGAELAFPSVAASFSLQEATVSSINEAFNNGVINAQK